MKICVVTSVYALSEHDRHGSFLVEVNRYLKQKGHDISVFAPSYEGLKDHSVEGIPVHRFRYFFKRWENLTHGQGAPNRIRNPFYLFVAGFYILFGLFSLIAFCRRNDFDVLHVHWPFPHAIWALPVSRLYKIPFVINFHGAELLLGHKFPFVKKVLAYAIRKADGVICNSGYTARQIMDIYPRQPEIIPYGVTIDVRSVQKDDTKAVRDLLFVGRLIRRKGLDTLIAALPAIMQKQKVHLQVVGDGDMKASWEALVRERKLQDVVTFHGVVSNEELEDLYAASDVFVLPAIVDDRGDTEGLGIVLVEALSYKTPVVASDVGGISDVIIDRDTGLLVKQKDADQLAAAIIELLDNKQLSDKLVQRGLEHTNSYFSWDRIIGLIESRYQAAVQKK